MRRSRVHINGEQKGRTATIDWNAPLIGDADEAIKMRTEFWIAKQVGEALCKKYPGREWHVDMDTENGILVIGCPSLSKRNGYRLHIRRDTVAQLIPRAIRAGGEILERFGVTRGRIIDPMTFEAFERDVRDDVRHTEQHTASRL